MEEQVADRTRFFLLTSVNASIEKVSCKTAFRRHHWGVLRETGIAMGYPSSEVLTEFASQAEPGKRWRNRRHDVHIERDLDGIGGPLYADDGFLEAFIVTFPFAPWFMDGPIMVFPQYTPVCPPVHHVFGFRCCRVHRQRRAEDCQSPHDAPALVGVCAAKSQDKDQ